MTVEEKVHLCQLVGVLLVTDGFLTDGEHEFFYGLMDELELPDDARTEVVEGIRIDAPIDEMISVLVAAGHGEELVSRLEAASRADGEASAVELDIVERVREHIAAGG